MRRFRHNIHRFEICTSTNDIAHELLAQGAPDGTVVVSQKQTHGRGRMGRSWLSREGCLALSLLLRPKCPAMLAHRFTLLAAVALAKCIEKFNLSPLIKWPNDVFLNDKKVAGILVEAQTQNGFVESAVLGIGLNITKPEHEPISDDVSHAGYLFCAPTEEKLVLTQLLTELEQWLSPQDETLFRYALQYAKANSFTIGKRVSIQHNGVDVSGLARDLSSNGALVIELDHGEIITALAGTLSIETAA